MIGNLSEVQFLDFDDILLCIDNSAHEELSTSAKFKPNTPASKANLKTFMDFIGLITTAFNLKLQTTFWLVFTTKTDA